MKYLLILLFLFSFSSAWALTDCPGSPLNINNRDEYPWHWDNYCTGKYIVTDPNAGHYLGDTFLGTFKKGREVHGTYTHSNGNIDFLNEWLLMSKVMAGEDVNKTRQMLVSMCHLNMY